MNFRDDIRKRIIKKGKRVLELGPLNWPIVSKADYSDIFFADIKSTDDIKSLYASNDYLESTGVSIDVNSIIDIDYVVSKSYKETFKNIKKFDVVYLSHVVEHMPDIIGFFKDIINIINKDGELVLIYPDSRYCFDHFRNGTTFIEAYDNYINKKPCCNGVFDFVNNVVHENRPDYFWNDLKQGNLLPTNDFHKSLEAYNKALNNDMPEDVHFWPFADYQFVKFLYDMDRAGLLEFDIKEFHETKRNTQEFMIVLEPKKKKNTIGYLSYKKILSRVSPIANQIRSDANTAKLNSELLSLREKNSNLNKELTDIYKSRRWVYVDRAVKIRKAILGK